MQIKWLRNAAKNLNDATEYIAEDNPKVARKFLINTIESINKLAQYLERARAGRVP
jgi:toxin ParE1/3/4